MKSINPPKKTKNKTKTKQNKNNNKTTKRTNKTKQKTKNKMTASVKSYFNTVHLPFDVKYF